MHTQPKETQSKIIKVSQEKEIEVDGKKEKVTVVDYQVKDFNFHKIWWKSLVSALDIVSNKKLKVVWWIIDNLDPTNKLIATIPEISFQTGISPGTVRSTIATLVEADFLRKLNKIGGAYQINPSMIFKGDHQKRMNILWRYDALDDNNIITNAMYREKTKAKKAKNENPIETGENESLDADAGHHDEQQNEKIPPGQTVLYPQNPQGNPQPAQPEYDDWTEGGIGIRRGTIDESNNINDGEWVDYDSDE